MGNFQPKGDKGGLDVKSHLVFTPLGTKPQKDQVGPKPESAPSAYRSARIPAVIFTHWREALNQAALAPAARSGYALALSAYLESAPGEDLKAFLSECRRC